MVNLSISINPVTSLIYLFLTEFCIVTNIILHLQEQKVQSEKDFNLLLGELGKDIEMMCSKHAEEKTALRWVGSLVCLSFPFLDEEILESSSKDLLQIYQPFTKDLPKIRKYLAFYFLNIYQKIYQ